MIDAYTFGRIVIDKKEYTRDVIIYPKRVDSSWRRKTGHELTPEDIQEILKLKPETLVVGLGHDGCLEILPETKRVLTEHGIQLRAVRTNEACFLYNELSKAGKRVVAALHLTC